MLQCTKIGEDPNANTQDVELKTSFDVKLKIQKVKKKHKPLIRKIQITTKSKFQINKNTRNKVRNKTKTFFP